MIKQKHNKHICFYLKDNIFILDIDSYIDDMALHVIDFVYDWHLIENNTVKASDKLIKELICTKIKADVTQFLLIVKENNCKLLSFLNKTEKSKDWHVYFDEHLKFIKFCKKLCKKYLPNFYESNSDYNFFLKRKGKFLNYDCVIPSGEDEEFINIMLDKIKSSGNYYWEL